MFMSDKEILQAYVDNGGSGRPMSCPEFEALKRVLASLE
jgi:hypothetical protein